MVERGFVGESTPKATRTLSLIWLVAFTGFVLVPMYLRPIDGVMAVIVGLIAAAGSWLPLMWIAVAAPGWRGVKLGEIDERQQQERAAAFQLAHQATGIVLMVLLLLSTAARYVEALVPLRYDVRNLVMTFAFLHLALPGIILAWRERSSED